MQHYALAGLVGGRPVLLESDVNHAVRVMRMRVSEQFVGMWDNERRVCTIVSLDPFAAVCAPEVLPSNEPRAAVIAILALTKASALEIAVQKVTENGVAGIVLLRSSRSSPAPVNVARLQRIVKEAAEQAHRDFVPKVSGPHDLDAILAQADLPGFVMDVDGDRSLAESAIQKTDHACFAIGPEGGWDSAELAAFKQKGFAVCRMSKTVLRAETAATVAAYELCWSVLKAT